jgi:hypothetical protein
VVVATRTSSRVPRDGIPIATKAINKAKAKDNTTCIVSSQNSFIVLNDTATASLKEVILDLDIEVENVEEQIDIFRVEELTRATIVEANYAAYLEKQKERQGPLSKSQLEDLAMEAISNKERNVTTDPAKGGLNSQEANNSIGDDSCRHSNEVHVLEC